MSLSCVFAGVFAGVFADFGRLSAGVCHAQYVEKAH